PGPRRPSSCSRCGWTRPSATAATGRAACATCAGACSSSRPRCACSCARTTLRPSTSTSRSGCAGRFHTAASSSSRGCARMDEMDARDLCVRVERYIRRHGLIEPGGEVTCLVSGGADSTCLWHVLQELDYRVSALHVDHGLRG